MAPSSYRMGPQDCRALNGSRRKQAYATILDGDFMPSSRSREESAAAMKGFASRDTIAATAPLRMMFIDSWNARLTDRMR
ncbi:hypothetical protein SAMN04487843_11161 [Methylobacterium sp. ap11]|nr:hypothetical protein SAMN04487843_11161 [Methylobacterium sp. ap11]